MPEPPSSSLITILEIPGGFTVSSWTRSSRPARVAAALALGAIGVGLAVIGVALAAVSPSARPATAALALLLGASVAAIGVGALRAVTPVLLAALGGAGREACLSISATTIGDGKRQIPLAALAGVEAVEGLLTLRSEDGARLPTVRCDALDAGWLPAAVVDLAVRARGAPGASTLSS